MESKLLEIVRDIEAAGGHCYLAGGAVRDFMYHATHTPIVDSDNKGYTAKDIDVEVYRLPANRLAEVLAKHGEVLDNCGKSFSVMKMRIGDIDYDFSLPRKETKVCAGHRGVLVNADPDMSTLQACRRRNFTINSALLRLCADHPMDPGNLVDHFGARDHIRNKVLKPVDKDTYPEDPLRNLIGLQQSIRFGFRPVEDDHDIYKQCQKEFHTLSDERIWGEWEKLLEKGKYFDLLFTSMRTLHLDTAYPELYKLSMTPQDPIYHPEGDVGTHSALAARWASDYCDANGITGRDKVILVLAALIHDIGKLSTTEYTEEGRITSKGHADSAFKNDASPGFGVLTSMRCPNYIAAYVIPLVREHMVHVGGKLSKAGVRRVAHRLCPASLEQLDIIIQADHNARPPLDNTHPCPELLGYGMEMGCSKSGPVPLMGGRHLIQIGIKPGPLMGEILKALYEKQLDGEFFSIEGGIEVARRIYDALKTSK